MKSLIFTATGALLAIVLSGCCNCGFFTSGKCDAEESCAKDVAKRIQSFKESPETELQIFSSHAAKEVYSRIGAFNQQNKLNTLSYTAVNKELNQTSDYLFDRAADAVKIVTRENGRIVSAFLYRFGRAFESFDGVRYYPVEDRQKINTLRFLLDFRMNFNAHAKNIVLAQNETFSNDGAGNVVKSAQEIICNGKRCNVLHIDFAATDYALKITVFTDTVDNTPVAMRFTPQRNLPDAYNKIYVDFINSTAVNGIIFQTGMIFTKPDKRNVALSLKDIKVNAPTPKDAFEIPANQIADAPFIAPTEPPTPKAVSPQNDSAKKAAAPAKK